MPHNIHPLPKSASLRRFFAVLAFTGCSWGLIETQQCNAQERSRDRGGERGNWGDRGGDRGNWGDRGGERGGDRGDWGDRGNWGDRGGERGNWGNRGGNQRGFDIEGFIRRLDTNGDGKLDPNEMSGRMESYLQNLGLDTTKSIPLETVFQRARDQREGRDPASTATGSAKTVKVPTFGAANEPVQKFGTISNLQLEKQFSEDVIRQVDEVMNQYDRDRNGFIDGDELERVSWGSPPYQQSDVDGDGRISRLELAYRYRARQELRRNEREGGGEDRRAEQNPRGRDDRGVFSSEPISGSGRTASSRDRSRNTGSASTRTARSSTSDSSSNDDRQKTVDYAKELFAQYDKDEDGKLSKAEIADMRNKPTLNSDGFLTLDEYTNQVLEKSGMGTTTVSAESSDTEGASSTRSRRRSTTTTRGGETDSAATNTARRSTTRRNFEDFDENQNGMIEMHEFAEEWDAATLEEFYQIDSNRDGMITRREWQDAGRR